jgi:ABC-type cobalamin/Fe3+-siderophores transport system ATPase subunit
MPIPLYSIKGLFVSKGGEDKLTIKQFDIHRGACYVFEGQMGSGKTTFLDILYSRRKTPRGEVKFEERDIHEYSNREYQDQIAIVPQEFKPPWGTVRNYMTKTIGKFSHIRNSEKRMDEISRKMNFTSILNRNMKSLTPGELRWVMLATMIGADSKVLFIDEIEQHLGKKDQKTLLSILHRKINYDGITLITSTQNKEMLSRIASVTITLDSGKITSVSSSGKKNERYGNNKYKKR